MSDPEEKVYTQKNTLSAVSRLFQALSGLFLIIFVAVHLYIAHVNFGHPIQLFNSVIQNLQNPWWFAFFIIFMWLITYHALNGVGNIVKDIHMSQKAKRRVNIVLTGIYFVTSIYGTLLAILISNIVA